MGNSLYSVDLGTGRKATSVVAGEHHNCVILENGQIKCWGQNVNGQLGLGDTNNRGDDHGELGDALPVVDLGANRTAKFLAAGQYHTCALLDNAQVKCWGHNDRGQAGWGDTTPRGEKPGQMGDALAAVDMGKRSVLHISSVGGHTCVILDDKKVKCWGENDKGQLGQGDRLPRGFVQRQLGDRLPYVDLGTGRTAKIIAAGLEHTCALLDNGQVKCWGHNNFGQLGLGHLQTVGDSHDQMGDALPSVDLGSGRTATFLAAGHHHNCARLDNGELKCWGYNGQGQLGLGDMNNRGDSAGEMGDALPAVMDMKLHANAKAEL